MTKNSNINGYLVGNYSQYLNALDFQKQDIVEGRNFIFILCTNQRVYTELKNNIKQKDWDNLWIFYNRILIFLTNLHIPFISGYFYLFNEYFVYKKARRIAKKFNYNYFAVGNYFYPTYRSISNEVYKKKIVVLDDGANIVNSVEYLRKDIYNNYLAKYGIGSLLF